jgi:hypothetical protein
MERYPPNRLHHGRWLTGSSTRGRDLEGYGVDIVLIIVGRGPPVSSYNVIALDMRAPELTPIVFLIPWRPALAACGFAQASSGEPRQGRIRRIPMHPALRRALDRLAQTREPVGALTGLDISGWPTMREAPAASIPVEK